MNISTKKEDALIKVSNRINYLNNTFGNCLEFINFKNNWENLSEAIILIKCLKYNKIIECSFDHFIRSRTMYFCEECRKELSSNKTKFKTRDEAVAIIQDKVDQINSNGYNISFLGFVNDYFCSNTTKTNLIIHTL